MKTFYKDPDEVLDYQVDWSDWLASGETISTTTFTVEAGLTKDSKSNTTTTTTVWVSDGTAGVEYSVMNEIVTNQSRTANRSFKVLVLEK